MIIRPNSNIHPFQQIDSQNLWDVPGLEQKTLPTGVVEIALGHGVTRYEAEKGKSISGLSYKCRLIQCVHHGFEETWHFSDGKHFTALIEEAKSAIPKELNWESFDFSNLGIPDLPFYQTPVSKRIKCQASFLLVSDDDEIVRICSESQLPVKSLQNSASVFLTALPKVQKYLISKPIFICNEFGECRGPDGTISPLDGMESSEISYLFTLNKTFSSFDELAKLIDHEAGHSIGNDFARTEEGRSILEAGNREIYIAPDGAMDLSRSDFPTERAAHGGPFETVADTNALIGYMNRLIAKGNQGKGIMGFERSMIPKLPYAIQMNNRPLSPCLAKKVAAVLELHLKEN